MAKIVCFCSKEDINSKFIYEIKKIINVGLSQIKQRIMNDEAFAEFVLFKSDHDENRSAIRALLNLSHNMSVPIRIYEVLKNELICDNEKIIRNGLLTPEEFENLLISVDMAVENDESWEALCEDD